MIANLAEFHDLSLKWVERMDVLRPPLLIPPPSNASVKIVESDYHFAIVPAFYLLFSVELFLYGFHIRIQT
jgi:hypothetical protein